MLEVDRADGDASSVGLVGGEGGAPNDGAVSQTGSVNHIFNFNPATLRGPVALRAGGGGAARNGHVDELDTTSAHHMHARTVCSAGAARRATRLDRAVGKREESRVEDVDPSALAILPARLGCSDGGAR
eukprot:5887853-Prymnesium_polylepis.1